jgi:hypothetical protein
MLTYPSLLVDYLLNVINFNLSLFRLILLLVIIIVAFNSTEKKPIFIFSKNIISYYTLGIVILFIGLSINSLVTGSIYLLRTTLLFPLFLVIMRSKVFDLKYFINFYLNVVFILALLSIIQYFLTPLGLIQYNNYNFLSEGMKIGFGGVMYESEKSISTLSRNIGFFTEPTNFAQMLIIPLFLSLYKLTTLKNIKNIFLFSTIGLAFALTFSVANFFGLLFGLIIYFYFKIKNTQNIKSNQYYKKILYFIFFIFIIIIIYYFFKITNETSYNSKLIIGKNTYSSYIDRINRVSINFKNIKDNPFGNLAFRDKFNSNSGFIGTVLIAGGFPYLMFWIFFLYYYYKRIFKKGFKSQYLLIYIGLVAYLLPMLWDVQFFEGQFLFYLALFAVILKYDKQGYRFV